MKSDLFFGPATKGLPKKCTMLLPVKSSHSTMPFLPTGEGNGKRERRGKEGMKERGNEGKRERRKEGRKKRERENEKKQGEVN